MTDQTLFQKIMARVTGKGLYDQYPELASRVPVSAYGMMGDSISSNVYQWHYNTQAWSSNPWVMKAVKIIGDDLASLTNIRVVRDEGDGNLKPRDHWINDLFQNMNPEQPGAEIWKQWGTDMLLGGEVGFELPRNQSQSKWKEIWPRQPIHFNVTPDQARGGARYLAVKSYYINDHLGDPYSVDPSNFIHFKFYNPWNPWRGISIMSAIRLGVSIDAMAQAWQYYFFKNQARPDYAIISSTGLSPTEKTELKKEVRDQMGDSGSHGIIVLDNEVMDIKPFDFANVDSKWVEERKLSREEIGGVFGIPDEIMGFGRDTYENFDTADVVKWTLTMVPLISFRDNALTHHMKTRVPVLAPNEFIQTDLSGVPQLQEDISDKINQVKELWAMGTPFNQAADFLGLGIEDIPGGDVGWYPFNLIPYDAAVASSSNGDEGKGHKSLRSNTKQITEYGSLAHERYYMAKQRRITGPAQQMGRKTKKYFQQQQDSIIQGLRDAEDEGKAAKQDDTGTHVIPDLGKLFPLDEWVQAFKDIFKGLFFNTHSNLMQIAWDELDQDEIDAELYLEAPEVVAQVGHFLAYQAQQINDATFLGLQAVFEDGISEGHNIQTIMESVNQYFGLRKSPYQVERITRTSMTGIDNSARQLAWGQSGVVKNKMWISALIPNRTRDAHAAAHGQTVPLNGQFEVAGEFMAYPGDPQGSAGNVINCLCTTKPEVE